MIPRVICVYVWDLKKIPSNNRYLIQLLCHHTNIFQWIFQTITKKFVKSKYNLPIKIERNFKTWNNQNFTWSQQTQIPIWILCMPESLLVYMFLINEVQLLWHKEQMQPSSAINLASNGSNWVQIATFVGTQL